MSEKLEWTPGANPITMSRPHMARAIAQLYRELQPGRNAGLRNNQDGRENGRRALGAALMDAWTSVALV